ncbi:DNA-3-methyladenine glycosylase family protein [Halovenus halobia]|uniref:DNA-3-methyladenine glycosylase family protein n=1 Tax=Halovenus halobia TaxID=3396622 RepID=UPI003F55049D
MDEAIAHLRADETLGPCIDEHGPLSLDAAENTFERLVVSLLRQQVSTDAAAAIRERLFDAVEVTPEGVLDADPETLRDAGLSEAKTEYVRGVAEAYQREGYDHLYFEGMTDEAVLDELTAIRGVGPWTGKMFLMFALGRPDVFPVEDLGIRRGMEHVFEEDLTRGEMCDYAGEWAPYRSYASLYLWRAYEG